MNYCEISEITSRNDFKSVLDKCLVFKNTFFCAGVAELVDAPDLGSGAERRGGSSPFTRTTYQIVFYILF